MWRRVPREFLKRSTIEPMLDLLYAGVGDGGVAEVLAFGLVSKAALTAICVGLCCGLLGSFVVVRRVALLGDAISHAVFPGVVLGFMLSAERNTWVIFASAVSVGLLGVLMVRAIISSTRLRSDAALGIVLASFFAVGVFWNSTQPQSGVKAFLYGDLTTVADADLLLMVISTVLVSLLIAVFFRPFRVVSFDSGFAAALGYPVRFLDALFFGLLAFTVVVAMQAVGVILVSAMLITPAAAAYLLTDKLDKMMVLAVLIGIAAALGGWMLANLDVRLQSGPMITLTASSLFGVVYLFAPKHGVVARILRHSSRRARVRRENTLKAIYHLVEEFQLADHGVSVEQLAAKRRLTRDEVMKELRLLEKAGMATWGADKKDIYLTSHGWQRAVEIVRNHRLWELYLTDQANYASDHVHDDAEKIEHVLGAEMVRRLERDLDFPELDPHGKPIPSIEKTLESQRTAGKQEGTGY